MCVKLYIVAEIYVKVALHAKRRFCEALNCLALRTSPFCERLLIMRSIRGQILGHRELRLGLKIETAELLLDGLPGF